MKDKLNTIYIISKGRPHCTTAQTLEKMNFKGDWYIVCGNNDATLQAYQDRWGARVLVFDWYEQVKTSDVLDPFGFDNKGSGCVPVRNAVAEISRGKGELRYWEFDDDYTRFYMIEKNGKKWGMLTGRAFLDELKKLSSFAHKCGLANMGFCVGSDSRPETVLEIGRRVFNAHNLPTDPALITPWRGRMNEDLINAIDTYKRGRSEYFVKYMMLTMEMTQTTGGGNTEIYQEDGTVRKTAYAVMVDPLNVKLVRKFGRYHHRVNWNGVIPKLISGSHA